MKDYQQRVVDEKAELDSKIAKLIAFQYTDMWEQLDVAEKHRMARQKLAMQSYSSILSERILAFTG